MLLDASFGLLSISACRWPAPSPARSSALGMRPQGDPAAGVKSLRRGRRRRPGGDWGQERKACVAYKGAPAAAPRRTKQSPGPAVAAPGRPTALQLPLHNKAVQMCPPDSKSS